MKTAFWRRTIKSSLFLLLLLLPLITSADIPRTAEWHQPWFARVDIQFPGVDFHARYDFWRCSCGDVLIRAEETEPERVTTGELLLLGGRTLLVRGFGEPQGNISHLLDSPMLMVQVLFALLKEAEPRGPAKVDAEGELYAREEKRDLKLDTGLATGAFPAPWEVRGTSKKKESGELTYDFTFTFENRYEGVSVGEASLKFSGVMDFGKEKFPYGDELPLDDWRLQEISSSKPVPSVQGESQLGVLRELVRTRSKN